MLRADAARRISGVCDQRSAIRAWGTGVGDQALSVDHKMPLEQISRLFADLYGYELNSETVETTLEQGYELAAPLE